MRFHQAAMWSALIGLAGNAVASESTAPRAVLATEMAECQRLVGPQPAAPAATDYPGGLSKSANGLTPATAPGATMVSPRLAACLVSAMGPELVSLQVVGDAVGIRDAWVQFVGGTRELTPEETTILTNNMKRVTGGDKNRTILVYCHHTSCFLSYNAVLRLKDMGYTNLLWMREGIKGWKEAGFLTGLVRDRNGSRQTPPPVVLQARPRTYPTGYPAPPNAYARTRYAPLKDAGLNLSRVCYAVSNKAEDKDHPERQPMYRSVLYKVAGVDPARDHEGLVRRKMQTWWQRYGDLVECGSTPSFGGKSLLKLATEHDNSQFLNDVVTTWQLPLNKVDMSDGWTVLDYLQDRLDARPEDYRIAPMYSQLRHAGALHRAELEEKGLLKKPADLQAEYLKQHKEAAGRGETSSMWYLVRAYARGQHVLADRAEAMRWLEKMQQHSIGNHDYDNMVWIGYAYQPDDREVRDVPADDRQFYAWMKRAADGNNPTGMLWAGRGLLYGTGITSDVQAGIAMLKKGYSVKPDDLTALELGRAYNQLGDIPTAATWLRLAPGLQPVSKGVLVEDWFKLNGLTTCGPRAGDNKPLC